MAKVVQGPSDTPVMRQYLSAKAENPDALLFFRLGDFYELFYEDAVVASRVLELTLTSRNKGAEEPVPMAGVPYHAASTYIQRLLDNGHSVALCEQMADPAKTKGIVPRQVVRVVSPGFTYDDAGLSAKLPTYAACIESDGAAFGIAAIDLSTGDVSVADAPDRDALLSELARVSPRELMVAQEAEGHMDAIRATFPGLVLRATESELSDTDADSILGRHRISRTPLASASKLALRAVARSVLCAEKSEAGRELPPFTLRYADTHRTLKLDEATQLHLELVRSMSGEAGSRAAATLLAQIDETVTAKGARTLRARVLAPSTDLETIRAWHDRVEFLVSQFSLRTRLRSLFAQTADLERLAIKCLLGRASPKDLSAIRQTLLVLPEIARTLDELARDVSRDTLFPGNATSMSSLDLLPELASHLSAALEEHPAAKLGDGPIIATGHDAALDQARSLSRNGQEHILALEAKLRTEAGIPSLKLRYTRVFGWYIEVTKTHVDKALPSWRRKQTIANGERYTCDELDELSDRLLSAEEQTLERETALFQGLVRDVSGSAEGLRRVASDLADWDVAASLAEVAHRHDYVRPSLDESLRLDLKDARHPVVERLSAEGRFVPNDLCVDAAEEATGDPRLLLITGPNMAGKSTLMRQAALCVVLAQMGSFVPAKRAHIGVVDRICTRVGASDNVARGESTFMVEMKETARVLASATRRSFVIVDEIGRGTSTYDGMAIACAVAEHLHDVLACRTLFATHYHELTMLADDRPTVANVSVSAREHGGTLVFLHKLVKGAASRSYGVACARLAGLPDSVLERARTLLERLEGEAPKERERPAPIHPKLMPRMSPQLGLFESEAEREAYVHPVLEQILRLDIDRLTPLDALNTLAKLKHRARTR